MSTLSHLLLWYSLRVILISAVFYGYYRAFLRNRRFHHFNRFFLLSIPLLSLILPFIHLPLGGYLWPADRAVTPFGVLHAVTIGDWKETKAFGAPSGHWSSIPAWQTLTALAYILVGSVLLLLFLRQLLYIRCLTRKYPREKIGNIHFFGTHEPGAPFSFLNNIFWDDQLDRNSPPGKQIFRHETNHVRQKHSLDLLMLRPLMALCWINPFFHLIHREIKAVHEFLADHEAISEGNRFQYAELLVWQTVRNPSVSLLHPLFHSPIKRRITMITTSRSTRPGFLSRVMILPLLFLLFCAFATRLHPSPNVRVIVADKPLTVVIDAGHGGIDPGATSSNGLQEKNINLAIAEKIKNLSAAYNVRVLMTREDDRLPGGGSTIQESLRYRTQLANENKADLFVAIHTDAMGGENAGGFNIYVSPGNPHYTQSVQLGSAMIEALKNSYATNETLKERKEGIWVLKRSEMPAVLVLCGNINNEKDVAFISKEENQEKIARDILQGIRKYAANK